MSAGVLILLGAVLCFLGTLSLRVGVLVAGFGLGWLLAEAFGAGTSTQLLVAGSTAVVGLVASLLVSRFLLFIVGAFVGAVIGARVFTLVNAGSEDGRGDWLLAVLFVPAVALACGILGHRLGKRFLVWGTAAAGAALICSGIGRIGHGGTDAIWRPDSTASSVIVAALWLGLTVAGHRAQLRGRQPAASS